jgi:hypothetical protein
MRGWREHWNEAAAKSQQSHSVVEEEIVILSGVSRRMGLAGWLEGYETGVWYLNRVYRQPL